MKVLLIIISVLLSNQVLAQTKGEVIVVQDPLIDSLIAKRLELNKTRPTATNPTGSAIVSSTGYRVQIYYGSDRREVFSQQAQFKSSYPKLNTYITYKEPNYYLRVGDYRTRLEAQKFLNELRPSYPTLFIFREKINAPILEDR
ncbi:SPOR domain-containing protein [Pedobacter xixiisoli]|uniref:Sporulation related domain-containing protein n=1 Tax=Pedobacter xixiisoli TaxID=1476464 RepID=A0A286A6F3_9SPHI|nr:SPOR domain-containing protein [Pedobacter xixiisoli]SOD17486.1 Sporulation related domain-containing protein [Pedobacter xixiisoli]